jgi:hypothetical protein
MTAFDPSRILSHASNGRGLKRAVNLSISGRLLPVPRQAARQATVALDFFGTPKSIKLIFRAGSPLEGT